MSAAGRGVAVIGGGLAGLQCARELTDRGIPVVVFDKGRRVGGRVCTRRFDSGAEFDHGAQYFTARGERFRRLVAEWVRRGVVAEWRGRLVQLTAGEVGPEPAPTTRYVGVPSMSALPKELAQGLPAVVSGRVTAVRRDAGGWQVDCEGSEFGTPVRTDGLGGGAGETASRFAGVVLALPAEQAQALLAGIAEAGGGTGRARPEARGQGGEARGLSLGQLGERVGGVSISPCWAVLLELRERVPVEYDGAFVGGSPLRWIARNNSKPGRRGGECWVLHAGPEWSREHLEAGGEWVAGELERAFWEATGLTDWGGTGGSVTARQAHRWRFALPEQPLADPFMWCPEWGLGVCGDWCGGPRVEGGWTSGARLGEELAGWWSGREGVVTD